MIFSQEDRATMRTASDSLVLASIGVEQLVASVRPDVTVPAFCPDCRRSVSECARTSSGYCSSGLHFEW